MEVLNSCAEAGVAPYKPRDLLQGIKRASFNIETVEEVTLTGSSETSTAYPGVWKVLLSYLVDSEEDCAAVRNDRSSCMGNKHPHGLKLLVIHSPATTAEKALNLACSGDLARDIPLLCQ